jgi:valyl-tRNA synthetase
VASSKDEAIKALSKKYGNNIYVYQDQDVLDTWFSSALLPISCLGWPSKVIASKLFFKFRI